MRKSLLIVGMCIGLCLTGCAGGTNSVDGKGNNNQSANVATKKPENKEPVKTVAPSITPVAEVEKQGIVYKVNKNYAYDWDEQKSMSFSQCHYDTIEIESKEHGNLAATLDAWKSEKGKAVEVFAKQSRDDYAGYPDSWTSAYVMDENIAVKRADSKVFSFVEHGYYEQGGVHGSIQYEAHTYDSVTGKEIPLSELVINQDRLAEAIADKLIEKYGADIFFEEKLAKYIKDTYLADSAQMQLKFTLGYRGISFYFGSYELASYADGTQAITLILDSYPGLFQSEYCHYAPDDYSYTIMLGEGNEIDVNGDGTLETVLVDGTRDTSDQDIFSNVTVKINGTSVTQDTYCYSMIPYYVTVGGKSYLYIQTSAENDSSAFMVFDITTKTPIYVENAYGKLVGFSNPNYFYIEERIDMLSTYFGTRLFHIGDNGMPVADSDEYTAILNNQLISTVELKGERVDATTGKADGTETFAKGTTFTILATDNETYVKMQAEDGRIGKFKVSSEWPQKINGKEADKCFKELYYAG